MKRFLPLAAIMLLWAATTSGNVPGSPAPYNTSSTLSFAVAEDPEQPETKIEIFPNPVTEGRITIISSEDIRTVQILNIAGKTVYSQEYEPNTASVVIELDKPEKGIYLVRIGFENKISHTEKIMVK